MRAMVFDRYGEPDVMHLRDVPVPEPQEGEVLIRVGYSGVNSADSKTRGGFSSRAGIAFPFVTVADSGPSRTAIPTHCGQHSGDCGQFLKSV